MKNLTCLLIGMLLGLAAGTYNRQWRVSWGPADDFMIQPDSLILSIRHLGSLGLQTCHYGKRTLDFYRFYWGDPPPTKPALYFVRYEKGAPIGKISYIFGGTYENQIGK